jgi:hypothetical protein
MTASTITYLVAREHISDLHRDADRHRLAAELRAALRVRLAVPRLRARRVPRAATA